MTTRASPEESTTDSVRFVLDGDVVELKDVDPTRTVLQYLRDDLRRTGTKEGCAEGDCGACTVVIAELNADGDDIVVRPINSCIQFLPTLDGKELITVESLARDATNLHPVQQALVDCHGSQCGFCTPGFVMSLFALYKTNPNPSRQQIDDALAGNLCRCTGYRPIIAAAEAMYGYDRSKSDWLRQPVNDQSRPSDRVGALAALNHDDSLAIEFNGRHFHAPESASALANILAETPDATLLAGGTDVGLWVTKLHRDLNDVVYTGRVQELGGIHVTDTHIDIGAAVTLADAMPTIIDHYPELEELFLRFASPPIRNAGTLGGNIANGSPIGDSMPALIALNTSLLVGAARGEREIMLEKFYSGYMTNDLRPGEFLQRVRIPLPTAGELYRSYKVSKRFDQDISAVCAGFSLTLSDDSQRVKSIRIAFGGLAETVRRAHQCEAALQDHPWNEATLDRGARELAKDFAPISDMRSSSDYRLRVAQNLLHRFYLETNAGVQHSVYGYGRAG